MTSEIDTGSSISSAGAISGENTANIEKVR
jgi:hypothetical protein